MSRSPSAFHAPAGQRHVGAVQAAALDPQVGHQDLPAGQFGGDGAGEVAGAGDSDLRVVAIGRNRTRYSPPARSTRPAGVSSAAIRPRSRIATRSHSSSTSSMKWLTSTTVTPLFLTCV